MQDAKQDWSEWHRSYDDPTSRLSRRLHVVQDRLREALVDRRKRVQIISMCAGEGRDVIGVLADHPRRSDVLARLVELDARIADVAEGAARAASLDQVAVLRADAASTDSYDGAVPADIILACGIFGNISDDDIRRTVGYLPTLCAANATVIWTRAEAPDRNVVSAIREWFDESGFDEVTFDAPVDDTFRVGVHRLRDAPSAYEGGITLFRFMR